MNKKHNPLAIINSVKVEDPCHESWENMTGDSRQRYCDQCKKSVHNLSEMTSSQAAELLANSRSRLCVRYYRNADGSIMTSDRRDTHETRFRRVMRRLVVSAASLCGIALASGCNQDMPVLGKPLIENGKNDEVMGEAPPSFFPESPQVMMGGVGGPIPEDTIN